MRKNNKFQFRTEPKFMKFVGGVLFIGIDVFLILFIFFATNITYAFCIFVILILYNLILWKKCIRKILITESEIEIIFVFRGSIKLEYSDIQKIGYGQDGYWPYDLFVIYSKNRKIKRFTIYCEGQLETQKLFSLFAIKNLKIKKD